MRKRKKNNSGESEPITPDMLNGIGDPLNGLKPHCGKMPLTPMTDTYRYAMLYGRRIAETRQDFLIKDGMKFEMHNDKEDGPIIQQSSKKSKGTSIVGITNIDAISGYNGTLIKFASKAFAELSRQAIYNGKRIADEVAISMQDMVRLGIANSERSARGIFHQGADMLSTLRMRGTLFDNGQEVASQRKMRIPFDGSDEGQKVGKILLNLHEGVAWELFTHNDMVIPDLYYRLRKHKASQLFYLIFAQCRRNIHKKKFRDAESHIKIWMEEIRVALALPKPSETSTPSRHIRGVIEAAIKEIQCKYEEDFHDQELELRIMSSSLKKPIEDLNIQEFLRFCFLRVKIRGKLRKDVQKVGGVKRRRNPPKKVDGEVIDDASGESPSDNSKSK